MISLTVGEAMSRNFARITADMPVVEATSALIKKAMIGSPVLDVEGKLVGWVSEQECLHVSIQVLYHNQRVSTVQKIMRKDVVAVQETDDLMAVATQMLEQKPKSYPVVNTHGKVVGVISRRDVLHALDNELKHVAKRK